MAKKESLIKFGICFLNSFTMRLTTILKRFSNLLFAIIIMVSCKKEANHIIVPDISSSGKWIFSGIERKTYNQDNQLLTGNAVQMLIIDKWLPPNTDSIPLFYKNILLFETLQFINHTSLSLKYKNLNLSRQLTYRVTENNTLEIDYNREGAQIEALEGELGRQLTTSEVNSLRDTDSFNYSMTDSTLVITKRRDYVQYPMLSILYPNVAYDIETWHLFKSS